MGVSDVEVDYMRNICCNVLQPAATRFTIPAQLSRQDELVRRSGRSPAVPYPPSQHGHCTILPGWIDRLWLAMIVKESGKEVSGHFH
jgi:hypothetical protein